MSKPSNFMRFGLSGDDSKVASRRLEALFGISMTLSSRDSYFWYGDQGERITVAYNAVADEDESAAEDGIYVNGPAYEECPLFVEVMDVADQDAYEKAMSDDPELKATRLVREVFTDGPLGEVICESYGPAGERTITRYLRGEQISQHPGD